MNVISLEVTKTNLIQQKVVKPPTVMAEMCWVKKYWPYTDKDGKDTFDTPEEPPSFMNYVLMSDERSFTEWHIDMGGTSRVCKKL